MRKNSESIIRESINDIIGGLVNCLCNEEYEEFERYNNVDDIYEAIYLDSIRWVDDMRFNGKENIINFIKEALKDDDDFLEIKEYLENIN